MIETLSSTFLNNFVLIFVAIDPFALIPIFAGITHGLQKKEIKSIYLRATFISFLILLFFSLVGGSLLDIMGININSFKIIGGLFLIVVAFEMVFEKRDERRQNLADTAKDDISVISLATFPLAIPLIAGPGAITITMLISEKSGPDIINQIINFIPITFRRGKIIFFDEKNYISTINDTDLDLIIQEDSKEAKLRGKFLNDNIYINFSRKKINNKPSTDIILKISNLNLLTKANYINSKNDKNILNGNILIKKDSHRFVGVFDYKNNEITINKSNLKNIFLNGKLEGKIKILPYFNFDLDLSLNSINFTKLYNHFLNLDDKNQKNLFRINRKINGKLGLSSDKIYSKYNLVKSFESRIKFNNGNILVEQFLFNLGKLGAADISGTINNDKKFTNFKYESNLFIDNQNFFFSKFGIYNKKSIPSSLFVSGNFDLQNIRSSFYEISDNEKLGNEDVNFIEEEFNDLMLTDGYENLFRFPKFVEFVKSITSEIN